MGGAVVKVINLTIGGMRGADCAERIHWALDLLPGVGLSDVSWEKGTARIVFDPEEVSEGRLRAVIEHAGYSVERSPGG